MTTQEQAPSPASGDGRDAEDRYDPVAVEARWQQRWAETGLYRTPDQVEGRDNWYHLTMLPYTSGDLHIGHWFAMAPSDTIARFRRMNGANVLFPMGFDAFGLPAENAAIARGTHPKDWTDGNIERMRGQLKRMGAMFDWEREVNTSAPEYYRWTVVVPQALRAGPRVPRRRGRQLVPGVQHRARQRAGRGRPLRTLRRPRRAAHDGAVVLPHHRLR